jgi:hypothetical protein
MHADGLDAFDKLSYIRKSLKESCHEKYDFSELDDLEIILRSSKNYLKF